MGELVLVVKESDYPFVTLVESFGVFAVFPHLNGIFEVWFHLSVVYHHFVVCGQKFSESGEVEADFTDFVVDVVDMVLPREVFV